MKKKLYLYCDPRSLNDATNYYVNLIRQAFETEDNEWIVVHDIKRIKKPNIIFTITAQYFLKAKLRYPFTKTIFWAQGLSAEEAKIHINSSKSRLRYIFRSLAEPLAIKQSTILFCVSHRMVEYYINKYGSFNTRKIIVMPCYNLHLNDNYSNSRYENPSFVYAGGSSKWQCIDTMLDVYAAIEQRLPNCHLTILSNDYDTFHSQISQRNIKNYDIKYVKVSELQDELQNYKYGFVLRDKNIINEVATPTKMNSYLSSLLIPIFSDGVDDFNRNIDLGPFKLMGVCPLDVNQICDMVIDFENKMENYSDYPRIVRKIFDNHYNDTKYIEKIREKFKTFLNC